VVGPHKDHHHEGGMEEEEEAEGVVHPLLHTTCRYKALLHPFLPSTNLVLLLLLTITLAA